MFLEIKYSILLHFMYFFGLRTSPTPQARSPKKRGFFIFILSSILFCQAQVPLNKECQGFVTAEKEYQKRPRGGEFPDTIAKIIRKLPRGRGLYKLFIDSLFQDTVEWRKEPYSDSVEIYPIDHFSHPYDFYLNGKYKKSLKGYKELSSDWVKIDTTVFLTEREKMFYYQDRTFYFSPQYWGEKGILTILDMTTCECMQVEVESNHHKINIRYLDNKWKIVYYDYYNYLK